MLFIFDSVWRDGWFKNDVWFVSLRTVKILTVLIFTQTLLVENLI